ncbi:MAG: nitroreductase family protein [Bacteroidales bacterium]|nr:nitroreductase family protein [Bacteroidales bacterium]
MNFEKLVLKTRSYRRFEQGTAVIREDLERLVNLARLTASAANRQPLKYLLFNSAEDCNSIFPSVMWAGYLTQWDGPAEGERPSAYIIIVGDTMITKQFGVDPGIAAQTIMLGATERGLGGCMIASFKKEEIREFTRLSERYEILLVLALGKPVERVTLESVKDDNIKYWRDEQGVHHVPKRSLGDIVLNYKEL